MCLSGGTAYHLEQMRHWWDSFPPGPTWLRVNFTISCSAPILPKYAGDNAHFFLTLVLTEGWRGVGEIEYT